MLVKQPIQWEVCRNKDHWFNRIIGEKCACDRK